MLQWLMLVDVQMVYYLQKLCDPSTIHGIAAACSQLGDPRYSYMIMFPIMFWWRGPRAGGHTLTISAFSEWLNIALKWLLRGDRPYWWVGLNKEVWPPSKELIQVPITCETGPGVPSGHVMISTAVLLTCTHYFYSTIHPSQPTSTSGANLKKDAALAFTRMCVLLFGVVIGLTRVLISSHFIHQVVLGLGVGYMIDKISSHSTAVFLSKLQWTLPNSKINLFISSAVLLLSGVGIYYGLKVVGLDPEFSVPLAVKYCQERSWVHPDTTPFYSLMRSTGALLGMAVMAYLVGDKMVEIERGWTTERLWKVGVSRVLIKFFGLIFSLVVVFFLHSKYAVPSFIESGDIVFYSVALFKTASIPCVTFLPCMCIVY